MRQLAEAERYIFQGQGIAGHYWRIKQKSYWVKQNYKSIVYAIDPQFKMSEVSSQFYADKWEDIQKYQGISQVNTYLIKVFHNWYMDKVKHLEVKKKNNLKLNEEIKETNMINITQRNDWREILIALNWCCETRDEQALVKWRLRILTAEECAAVLGVGSTQALSYRWKKLLEKIQKHTQEGQ